MKHMALAVVAAMLTGCAAGINSAQKQELESYKTRGFYVQEKNEGTAAALGILPGGGSFYARSPGLGILNLLLWPISILWDPISGVSGSQSINYYATKANAEKLRKKEMRDLDEQLALGKMDNQRYVLMKNEIDRKYEP